MAFKCVLVTPESCLVDADVWQVTVPGKEGRFSIRTGHAPIVATMKNGILEIALSEKERMSFSVMSGMLEHKDNQCNIICDHAEKLGKS